MREKICSDLDRSGCLLGRFHLAERAMGVSSGDAEKCAQAAIDAVFNGQAITSAP
jgi:hypothetical protein